MDVIAEAWKPVVGFEKYEVSTLGNVRKLGGSLMNQHDNDGYQMVFLYDGIKSRGKYVHRLMLDAFVGPAPKGFQACHGNGVRFDNKIENLRWGSKEENWNDKRKHGNGMLGEQHPNSVFSYGCIERIRDMHACGVPFAQIAKWFGVSAFPIQKMIKERRWGALTW